MVKIGPRPQVPPERQPDTLLVQANPVSGTKYLVLDTTPNVRIKAVAVRCTWTVQPSKLELHVTVEGTPYSPSVNNPPSTTWYYLDVTDPTADFTLTPTGTVPLRKAWAIECRRIKIEVEITGGTVSELRCRVKWGKW